MGTSQRIPSIHLEVKIRFPQWKARVNLLRHLACNSCRCASPGLKRDLELIRLEWKLVGEGRFPAFYYRVNSGVRISEDGDVFQRVVVQNEEIGISSDGDGAHLAFEPH